MAWIWLSDRVCLCKPPPLTDYWIH
jgi:hypothetical protein